MMMNTMNKNNKKPLSESTEWKLIGHYAEAKERIAALEAEVERLRSVNDDNKSETEATRIENARLRAENERLRDGVKTIEYHANGVYTLVSAMDYDRLKRENERLTKALEEEAACMVGHQENAILIGRLEAQVERLQQVVNTAYVFLGDCKNLETPACNAYALLSRNAKSKSERQ